MKSLPERRTMTPLWLLLCLAATWLSAGHAVAQEQCTSGQGDPCTQAADCAANANAKLCVAGACQVPCVGPNAQRDPSQCILGETCVAATAANVGATHYCASAPFRMDLNLLDQCIYHFLEGIQPDLTENSCSLSGALSQLLDQDGQGGFTINDVDLCIKTFLDAEACDSDRETCDDGTVYCESDFDCGAGAYCDGLLNRCQRECGLVGVRATDSVANLDRQCAGALKVCDYTRGRCRVASLEGSTCQVDADCPNASYCFVGQCTPKCYQTTDCPDATWYCSDANQCLPRPRDPDGSRPFDPRDYSLRFSQTDVALDAINDRYQIPLVIMNMATKEQVVDDGNVVFGYRLEATYGLKQEQKCFGDLGKLSAEDREDCLISADEEFLTLANPFGTVFGTGRPSVGISINHTAVKGLSPGQYQAVLRAIFNNGSSVSATVTFRKKSPNGDYTGRLSVYKDVPENLLTNTNLGMRIHIDQGAPKVEFDRILQENNLPRSNEFKDITRGYRVTGYIDGRDSMTVAYPGAYKASDNKIAIRGIYAEDKQRLRLIAVVDLPAQHCRSEDGACSTSTPDALTARNRFGRNVQRIMHFIGPFDPTLGRFEGLYREDIHGMLPSTVTLEGGFILNQVLQDDGLVTAPTHVTQKLIADGSPGVAFPDVATLRANNDAEVSRSCRRFQQTLAGYEGAFADRTGFRNYLAQFHEQGPVFDQLITFESRIQTAPDSKGALTLADFFRGQIQFCDPPRVTDQCVDPQLLQCGMALYRRALLNNWVSQGAVGPGDDASLFCHVRPGVGQDCPAGATEVDTAKERALVAMQEHNRFYKELVQTHSYGAANAISDAFYTLFKASAGDPLDADAAFAHKDLNLQRAVSAYGEVQRILLSADLAHLLQTWPMDGFAGRGRSWIRQMHATMNDRLEALLELIDLRRRILRSQGSNADMFARHVMHYEYLHQVYMLALQQQWEGSALEYAGQGPAMLAKGQALLAKTDESRNPLGLHPNRIYFENSDLNLSNWHAYRSRLQNKLPDLEQTVQEAITQMRNALTDRDNFESNILLTQHEVEAALDQMCGKPASYPVSCLKDRAEKEKLVKSCGGGACDFKFKCEGIDGKDSRCDTVEAYFHENDSIVCRSQVDTRNLYIDAQGGRRLCANGQMGSLLEERVALQAQQKQVVQRVQALMRSVARQEQAIRDTQSENKEIIQFLEEQSRNLLIMETALSAADLTLKTALTAAGAVDCLVIVGLAAGTDCPQKIASNALYTVAQVAYAAATETLRLSMGRMARNKELKLTKNAQYLQLEQMRMGLDNLVTEIENLTFEYNAVMQQRYNNEVRIQDLKYQASQTAFRHMERIEDIVDHLLGRESGSVLVRNGLVQQANIEFREILTDVYKMAQAFAHRYNLGKDVTAMQNQVFSILTVKDIRDFIKTLDTLEGNYCGTQGLDCDAVNNQEVFEFSLQKQLFPELRQMEVNGSIITVGQQFHNEITSSRFLRRRPRASGMRTQLEIPFAIWLNDRGTAGGAPQRYMVNPEECNHFLVGGRSGQGTVAVNVVGTRLRSDKTITYELWRGNTDYVRDCQEKLTPVEPKVNSYIVGYTPESAWGQLQAPPSFITQSSGFKACENAWGLGDPVVPGQLEGCFKYFARDRSLGSPDWKLIIPLVDEEQAWLFGEGLPQNEQPVIEDIVLYFRYNARPIVTN
jgi:hypothetical protein